SKTIKTLRLLGSTIKSPTLYLERGINIPSIYFLRLKKHHTKHALNMVFVIATTDSKKTGDCV
ncbi:MAG: hypothetical protein L0H35_06845, partial [Psychrobacter sp.]|nr:hypothetical protein [Psychrobacter sp.]